jgi:3-oxoacyl-[acyl-carrier protein] reductase
MHLKDRVAIVTGGSRGIGRAIVERLADDGANIAFTYKQSEDQAIALVRRLEKMDCNVIALQADANSMDEALEVITKVEASFGHIDILVNNAGITRDKPLILMTQEEWHSVLDLNLTGVFNYSKAVAMKMFRRKSGHIVNISSYSGVSGAIGQTNYAASKAGIIGFTKALARELAAYNVTVNAVAPGFVETEMLHTLSDKYRQGMLQNIPLRRFGTSGEIAGVVSFLLSEDASYITGQIIQVDGGLGI